jgi:hypothetical protein
MFGLAPPHSSTGAAPLEAPEGDPSLRVELDSLDLEPDALLHVSFRDHLAETQPAPRVDHAVPRHIRVLAQCVESVAHLARVPGESGERRDLAVGGDAPRWDTPDHRIDEFVSALAFQFTPSQANDCHSDANRISVAPFALENQASIEERSPSEV